ncbi:MAG: hypothetical protein DME64_04090 [Verrucomicrobia bacterium]|nr:MAG: hypothetical protein DME64_04090 [Verrucomicrobiota bacterium]
MDYCISFRCRLSHKAWPVNICTRFSPAATFTLSAAFRSSAACFS